MHSFFDSSRYFIAGVLLGLGFWGVQPGTSSAQNLRGQVTGHIVARQSTQNMAGLRITLLRFVLDANTGQPQGKVVQIAQSTSSGQFAFKNIPLSKRSVWRVQVHWQGQVIRGPLFTLQQNALKVEQILHLPATHDASPTSNARPNEAFAKPFVQESLLVLTPHLGALQATWVLHIQSPLPVSLQGQPLVLGLPAALKHFEILHVSATDLKHQRTGNRLVFSGVLPAGNTVIALQMRENIWFGATKWGLKHSLPVGLMSVLTPPNTLQVHAAGFAMAPPRQLEGRLYNLVIQRSLEANTRVNVRTHGIPQPLWLGYFPLPLLLIIPGWALSHLLRKRLRS